MISLRDLKTAVATPGTRTVIPLYDNHSLEISTQRPTYVNARLPKHHANWYIYYHINNIVQCVVFASNPKHETRALVRLLKSINETQHNLALTYRINEIDGYYFHSAKIEAPPVLRAIQNYLNTNIYGYSLKLTDNSLKIVPHSRWGSQSKAETLILQDDHSGHVYKHQNKITVRSTGRPETELEYHQFDFFEKLVEIINESNQTTTTKHSTQSGS